MKITRNGHQGMTLRANNTHEDYAILLCLADILGLEVKSEEDNKYFYHCIKIKRESQYYKELKSDFEVGENYWKKESRNYEKKCTTLRKQLKAKKIKPEV